MRLIFSGKKSDEWKGKRKGRIISIQVSEELYAELDNVCKRYGIKKSQFIRDAVIEKLARLESTRNA